MRRGIIIAAALLVVLGALGGGAVIGGPKVLETIYPLPENELIFPHNVHAGTEAGQLALECEFCHRTAEISRAATVPSLEQCMFCHKVVGDASERVGIVRAAWEAGEPLEWIRQHRIPDHTQFRHEPHLTEKPLGAGLECSVCHGDVGSVADQVTQVRVLEMGDCVGCHKQNGAPTQCATCHT